MLRGVASRRLALSRGLAGSPRLRVLRLLWETSPVLTLMMGLFVLADGFLPIVALVALGRRQVAVVNQDFGRYPLSEQAAAQAGALEFVRALPRRCARLTSPHSPKRRDGSCTPPDSAPRSSPSCCAPRTATPPRAPWSRSSACCAAPSGR